VKLVGIGPARQTCHGVELTQETSHQLVRVILRAQLVELPEHEGQCVVGARDRPLRKEFALPRETFPVGSGQRRAGKRLLTVGTDCAVGKKYTALALDRELRRRGVKSDFRATGQTGLLIAGRGIVVDAVVSDFIAGAAEALSPVNRPDHWDIVEGQGSLFHPSYAGVTLGLIHGTQPDALVVCHDPLRKHLDEMPEFQIPDVAECAARHVEAARLTNPRARCVGVSVNTSKMTRAAAVEYEQAIAARMGVPCVDPMRDGVALIAEYLLESA